MANLTVSMHVCGAFVCRFMWMFEGICVHWDVCMMSSSFEIQEYL